MALIDDVKARYNDQKLVELTNVNDRTATTVNDTLLGEAIEDVEADFEVYVGVVYDSTDRRHVSVAVQGVVYKLRLYTGRIKNSQEKAKQQWIDDLKALAKVTARDRIVPTTDSKLCPTGDSTSTTNPEKPRFDRDIFRNIRPGKG